MLSVRILSSRRSFVLATSSNVSKMGSFSISRQDALEQLHDKELRQRLEGLARYPLDVDKDRLETDLDEARR